MRCIYNCSCDYVLYGNGLIGVVFVKSVFCHLQCDIINTLFAVFRDIIHAVIVYITVFSVSFNFIIRDFGFVNRKGVRIGFAIFNKAFLCYKRRIEKRRVFVNFCPISVYNIANIGCNKSVRRILCREQRINQCDCRRNDHASKHRTNYDYCLCFFCRFLFLFFCGFCFCFIVKVILSFAVFVINRLFQLIRFKKLEIIIIFHILPQLIFLY